MANVHISNTATLQKYKDLPQGEKVIAEYVWIDTVGGLRSKSKTVDRIKILNDKKEFVRYDDFTPDNLDKWNFDGSSTKQATGKFSDVYLLPKAVYPCPFRLGNNILVLCETQNPDGKPNAWNFRHDTVKLLGEDNEMGFMWGIEQEYTLFDVDGLWPYGWPKGYTPGEQDRFYCGNGARNAYGRDIVEAHYKACIYAGINISGTNAEVMPSQWEFQVGPTKGIAGADELWMARFILHRVAEEFGAVANFDCKPLKDYNGAGLHTNVSTTATMDKESGMKAIEKYMGLLEKRHKEHMTVYGESNQKRMTGAHETASYDTFSWGVGNRGSSVRVNAETAEKGWGYFEDRRPASDADPYRICAIIVETIRGGVEGVDLVGKVEAAEKGEQ